VRAACLQIIRTVLSFPKFFGDTAFKLKLTFKERQSIVPNYYAGSLSSPGNAPPKGIFDAQNYAELLPHMDFILLESLRNETTVSNILTTIQLCYAHSCLYIGMPEWDFAVNTILTIVSKCVTQGKWSRGVTYAGLKIVGRMSYLFPHLPNGKEVARKIMNQLCTFVISLCTDLYRIRQGEADKQKVRLAIQTFLTITGECWGWGRKGRRRERG
jgi:hypothetical protein